MARYRKKSIVIEAVKLGWDTWNEIGATLGFEAGGLKEGNPEGCYIGPDGKPTPDGKPADGTPKMGLLIPTLEGLMLGTEGDYIIRGVKGELYPCKPDVFEASYDRVAPVSDERGPWRVVDTDNFGGDYPNEEFVGPVFRSRDRAELVADTINSDSGPNASRFWKVVPEGYKLQPGFEP